MKSPRVVSFANYCEELQDLPVIKDEKILFQQRVRKLALRANDLTSRKKMNGDDSDRSSSGDTVSTMAHPVAKWYRAEMGVGLALTLAQLSPERKRESMHYSSYSTRCTIPMKVVSSYPTDRSLRQNRWIA